jgi:uncharacterized protein with PIN domain
MLTFLCDHMLVRLGRWLRAAGYDTIIAEKTLSDPEILQEAIREDRYLITRDRHFLAMKDKFDKIVWLEGNSVDECLKELSQKLPIDWMKDPFSRCLLCNAELVPAGPEKKNKIPERVQGQKEDFLYCPACDKIYWFGTHTDRMLAKLKGLSEEES